MAARKLKPQHGHWGEIYLNSTLIAEATAVEYTIEMERIEVPQSGTRQTSYKEGMITSQGELRLHHEFSDFATAFLRFVTADPDTLRAQRNAGIDVRPTATLKVSLDDPRGWGREYETLTGVLFWQYTGGYDITALTGRVWPFTFDGIITPEDSRILRDGSAAIY